MLVIALQSTLSPLLSLSPRFRQGVSSELSEAPASQLDQLTGMLKDPPAKYSLKKDGLHFSPTPALSVVHNPSVDANIDILSVSDEGGGEDSAFKGYVPGPRQSQSLKRDGNTIPRYGRGTCGHGEDGELTRLHQQDFRYALLWEKKKKSISTSSFFSSLDKSNTFLSIDFFGHFLLLYKKMNSSHEKPTIVSMF